MWKAACLRWNNSSVEALLAAKTFGLTDRAEIRVGNIADIVVLDPATFAPRANFDGWNVFSTGGIHVTVNGELAIRDGQYTGALAGRVLAGSGKAPER